MQPEEAGLYYCCIFSASTHYDSLVRVSGQAPFLRIDSLVRLDNLSTVHVASRIFKWGPLVETPKVEAIY